MRRLLRLYKPYCSKLSLGQKSAIDMDFLLFNLKLIMSHIVYVSIIAYFILLRTLTAAFFIPNPISLFTPIPSNLTLPSSNNSIPDLPSDPYTYHVPFDEYEDISVEFYQYGSRRLAFTNVVSVMRYAVREKGEHTGDGQELEVMGTEERTWEAQHGSVVLSLHPGESKWIPVLIFGLPGKSWI